MTTPVMVVRSADECPFRLPPERHRVGGPLGRYTVTDAPRCRVKAATCTGMGDGCPLRNSAITIQRGER